MQLAFAEYSVIAAIHVEVWIDFNNVNERRADGFNV